MVATLTAPMPTLQLEPPPPLLHVAVRAMLYDVLAELIGKPPAPRRMRHVVDVLDTVPVASDLFQAAIIGLRQAARDTLRRPTLQVAAWKEFSAMVGETCHPVRRHLYAKNVCDEDTFRAVNNETCPYETGKPCPFGDYYCVNRMGAPCDHLSAGLQTAAHLYADWAAARNAEDMHRAQERCRRFAAQHLRVWIRPAADRLFHVTDVPLYRAAMVLADMLIEDDSI